MPETVLVTEPEYRKGEQTFAAATDFSVRPVSPDEHHLAETIDQLGCQAVVVGVNRYEGPLYQALGRASGGQATLLARFGVGHDGIDKALARRHGVLVTNTPGVLDASVAEHAFALMLGLCRRIGQGHAALTAGRWQPVTGLDLGGRTLGLIGFGPIARRVAAIAARGFGLRVLACGWRDAAALAADEGRPIEAICRELGVECYGNDPAAVLAEADIVSLHLPGSVAGFINADRLAQMKPGALLINTARGSVVDEVALYDALAAGHLAGAALDVYGQEPYQPVDPQRDLRRLEQVLLTPHVGSNTAECNARMAAACLRNLRAFYEGRMEALDRVDR